MRHNEKRKQSFFKKAKAIIGEHTPLKKDCGQLCGSACCKGDGGTGMLLFPNEETSLKVIEKGGVRLAVCDGKCDRHQRPLSCMIFPFFPTYNEKGRVEVKTDLRGRGICPMIDRADEIKFNRGFLWRVKKLGRYLAQDEECREFMEGISEEIRLLESFLYTK